LIKKDWFIALNITLLILLLFAWNERWSHGPKQSREGYTVTYKKDNWTNQIWLVEYSLKYQNQKYGKQTAVPKSKKYLIDPWAIRNAFNWGWIVMTFSTLFFSVNGLLGKTKLHLSRKSEGFESID
jgi:hypothetical protein